MKVTRSFLTPFFMISILYLCASCESPLLSHDKLSEWRPTQSRAGKHLKTLDLYLNFKWEAGPFGDPSLESIFEIEFKNLLNEREDLPTTHSLIHYGWMPDMGHGSADDGILVWKDIGVHRSQYFAFNMPGFWQMHFLLYKGSTLVETVVFDFYF